MVKKRAEGNVRFRVKGEENPKPLELSLRQVGDSVDVMLGPWVLIGFKAGGKLMRYNSIPASTGLPLDDDGRMLFTYE